MRGAVPGTYQVFIHGYLGSSDCTGDAVLIPTATLTTNARGNGEADAIHSPAEVAPFRGLSPSIMVTVEGPATYTTDCAVVTLD